MSYERLLERAELEQWKEEHAVQAEIRREKFNNTMGRRRMKAKKRWAEVAPMMSACAECDACMHLISVEIDFCE